MAFTAKVTRWGIRTYTPTTISRLFTVGLRGTTTSRKLRTMVVNPFSASPLSNTTGKAQLAGKVYNHTTEPQPIEQGTIEALVGLTDALVLCRAYHEWYLNGGGREEEKELLKIFNKLTVDTPMYAPNVTRFQRVMRQAVEREHDDDDDSLMKMCRQAITAHGKYDADAFVEMQRIVMDSNGSVYKRPSAARVRTAAYRQLAHWDFVEKMIGVLPEV